MKFITLLLSSLSVLTLAACDLTAQKTAEVSKSANAVETNLRVIELAREGKTIEALRFGEEYLKSGSDPEGALHATLAKLYTEIGDTESAVRHLDKVGGSPNTSTTVIITHEDQSSPPPPPQPARPGRSSDVAAATDGAAAMIGPNGVEARAGGASASVRN